MKIFGSYTVEFNGCNHIHHFDYCIGWHYEGSEIIDGEFIIKGLKNSFNSQGDYTDIVQFLLNQYSLYA